MVSRKLGSVIWALSLLIPLSASILNEVSDSAADAVLPVSCSGVYNNDRRGDYHHWEYYQFTDGKVNFYQIGPDRGNPSACVAPNSYTFDSGDESYQEPGPDGRIHTYSCTALNVNCYFVAYAYSSGGSSGGRYGSAGKAGTATFNSLTQAQADALSLNAQSDVNRFYSLPEEGGQLKID